MHSLNGKIMVKLMRRTKILVSILLIIWLVGCSGKQGAEQELKGDAIIVAATFYPLYDLTKSIVMEKGIVYSIVPAGIEPHDYEPNPSDLQKLSNADVFVIMGIEFAEFEEDLGNVNSKAKAIPSAIGISLLKTEEEENEAEDEPEHTGEDPHIWLSPKNAQKMTLNIMNGIIGEDPSNGEYYLKNGQELIDNLKALDEEFKEGLSSCNKDVILVNHNAFSYLARDYGFSTIEISGLEPEVEPTPQQLAKLIQEAKKHNIKYIFYEELVDSRVVRTIADEIGAQVLVLDPIEGASNPSDTYFTLSRKNLKNLRTALGCK